MTFANLLPWWALGLVLAAIAATAWLAYAGVAVAPRRRRVLVALRFVTLLLLVLFLMRPIRTTQDGTRDAVVPILVDGSRSMSIEDNDGDAGARGRRRIDRARDLVTGELLPLLGPRFHTEVLSFGEGLAAASPADLGATARRSDLSSALSAVRERYRGRPIAGIVLLSDGGDTGGVDLPDDVPPVYAIGVGAKAVGRDREVLSVTAAEAVFDDSRVDLAVSAVSHGHGTEPIAMRLLENGRPIEVRRAAPAADGVPVREVFHVSPARGAPTVYTIEIPETPGDLVPENNSRSTLVQPPSRQRRILFVEGAPGFEHSFLKRAWATDSGLEVDSVVRKGKNEEGADTFYIQASRSRSDALMTGYPKRVEDLFAYDALVLANVEATQLSRTELDTTRAFVAQRGGGLLVLGARSFAKQGLVNTPLEEVLPLQLSDRGDAVLPAVASRGMNLVGLSPAGETHPVMQLGSGAGRDPQTLERGSRARVDLPARRSAAGRRRAGRDRRRRRGGTRARRRAALRRRAVHGLHGGSRVALAHAAAVLRSFVRHVLAAGGAVARAAGPRSDRHHPPCRRLTRRDAAPADRGTQRRVRPAAGCARGRPRDRAGWPNRAAARGRAAGGERR